MGGCPSASVTGLRTRTKKKRLKQKRGNTVGGPSAEVNDVLSPPFLANVTLDEAMMRDDNVGENNGDFCDPLLGKVLTLLHHYNSWRITMAVI